MAVCAVDPRHDRCPPIQVVCAFNNDEEGKSAAAGLQEMAALSGVSATLDLPTDAKDWNEALRVSRR